MLLFKISGILNSLKLRIKGRKIEPQMDQRLDLDVKLLTKYTRVQTTRQYAAGQKWSLSQ